MFPFPLTYEITNDPYEINFVDMFNGAFAFDLASPQNTVSMETDNFFFRSHLVLYVQCLPQLILNSALSSALNLLNFQN